ncbi:MAG: hypothetical protein KAI47_20990 [Deltaproteobacteria bacterium]|nr:hypothetical protein [Deltaproteobacteria bacterium]
MRTKLVEEVRTYLFGNNPDEPPWLWITGPDGTGRRAMARLLAAEVEEEQQAQPNHDDASYAAAVQLMIREPEGGWDRAALQQNRPVIAVAHRCPWDETSTNKSYRVTEVEPWDHREMEAISRRLRDQDVITDTQLARCLDLSDTMKADPWFLGTIRHPGDLIGILDMVRREESPQDRQSVRNAWVNEAWRRAVSRAPKLKLLGEEFMETFWSRMVNVASSPFTFRMEKSTVLPLIGEVLHETRRSDVLNNDWEEHLKQLLEARGPKKREDAAEALRTALLKGEPAVVLESLVSGGLLLEEDKEIYRATDPFLARVWAARGVSRLGTLDLQTHPERLLESGWQSFVVELGIAGLAPEVIEASLSEVPSWGAIEIAQTRVVFAAARADDRLHEVPKASLYAAWHGALWAWLLDAPHEKFKSLPDYRSGQEKALLTRAFFLLSIRMSGRFPDFATDDPFVELEARVPETIRVLAQDDKIRFLLEDDKEAHRRRDADTEDTKNVPPQDDSLLNLSRLSRRLVSVAPGQWLPWTPQRAILNVRDFPDVKQPGETTLRETAWKLMERRAEDNDQNARDLFSGTHHLLDGGGWLGTLVFDDFWTELPALPRLRWIGVYGSSDRQAFWRLWKVVHQVCWPPSKVENPLSWLPESAILDLVIAALKRFPIKFFAHVLEESLVVPNQLATMNDSPSLLPALKLVDRRHMEELSDKDPTLLSKKRLVEILNHPPPVTPQEVDRFNWLRPQEIAPHVALEIATRLSLIRPLLTAMKSYKEWRENLGADRMANEDEALPNPWHLLEALDDFAEDIAVALGEMKEKKDLQERWNHGKGPNLPRLAIPKEQKSNPLLDLQARATKGARDQLLRLNDPTPIRDWLEALQTVEYPETFSPKQPHMKALDETLKESPKYLRWANDLCQDAKERARLFAWLFPCQPPSSKHSLKLDSWMFQQAADSSTDAASRFWFLETARKDPRAEDLLRSMIADTENLGTRIFLAYRLHDLKPWDPMVLDNLWLWLEEAPDPLSNSAPFHFLLPKTVSSQRPESINTSKLEPPQVIGGAVKLLRLLHEYPDLKSHRERALKGVQRLLEQTLDTEQSFLRKACPRGGVEFPTADDPQDMNTVPSILAALLRTLDDRETVKQLFSDMSAQTTATNASHPRRQSLERFRGLLAPWFIEITPEREILKILREYDTSLVSEFMWQKVSDKVWLELLDSDDDAVAQNAASMLLAHRTGTRDSHAAAVAKRARQAWPADHRMTWIASEWEGPYNPWVNYLWTTSPEECLARLDLYLKNFPDEKYTCIMVLAALSHEDGPHSAMARKKVRQLLEDSIRTDVAVP